ncbi:MAG TPA: hypothetical protein VMA55_23100, partial [Acidovorax sp.]|nr:hypothetical protein [Acidovorax sp.]
TNGASFLPLTLIQQAPEAPFLEAKNQTLLRAHPVALFCETLSTTRTRQALLVHHRSFPV